MDVFVQRNTGTFQPFRPRGSQAGLSPDRGVEWSIPCNELGVVSSSRFLAGATVPPCRCVPGMISLSISARVREGAGPFLQPAEEIQFVVPAIIHNKGRVRAIVATNQRLLLFGLSYFGQSPTKILAQMPRSTTIGPAHGSFGFATHVFGMELLVRRRYYGDIAAMDEGPEIDVTPAPYHGP